MAKIYRYHLVDREGVYWEKNIPERKQAETFREFLEQTHTIQLEIEEEHCPQATGLGRDPDLH